MLLQRINSQQTNKHPKYSLEQILQTRIGYGEAQNALALPLYILLFTEGCESIVISLLLPELELEWGISILEKSFLITAIFCGVGFGTFLQSYSDDLGRKIFFKWNSIFQAAFGFLSCLAPSMSFFILLRFFYGACIGVAFPLSRKYINEITPAQNRLMLLTKLRTYFAIGCLFTYIIGWVLLQNNQWRLLLFINCLPQIYALYQINTNGKQSLKFLWDNNKHQQAYELVLYMTKLNRKNQIPKHQIQSLISSQKLDIQKIQYKDLLHSKYKNITLTLMFCWFAVFFIYYGVFLFLPTVLSQQTDIQNWHDLKYLIMCTVVVFQILCSQLSRPIMEHQMFGRKRTLYCSLFMVGLFSLGLMVAQSSDMLNFVICFIAIKIFITFSFMTVFPYTMEIYSTLINRRSKGIFLASGRVGTVLLGFLGLNALYCLDGNGLYLIFTLLSFAACFLIVNLPFQNLSRVSNQSFFFG